MSLLFIRFNDLEKVLYDAVMVEAALGLLIRLFSRVEGVAAAKSTMFEL